MGPPALERGTGRMIEAKGITVRYGDRLVLDRYDFSAPEEGLTFLSSPSGEGKTTLLRVLAGLLTPETGQVSLPGRPVILFQEDRLFPGLSVRRQVEAVLPKGRREEAGRWLELTELTQAAHLLPGELSGGMARRASLARALALEGEICLLDEPFTGVDLDRAKRILEGIRLLGKPVILTGHIPELAALCDRTVEL